MKPWALRRAQGFFISGDTMESAERLLYRQIFSWLEIRNAGRRYPASITRDQHAQEELGKAWQLNLLGIAAVWKVTPALKDSRLQEAVHLAGQMDITNTFEVGEILKTVKQFMLDKNLR